MKSYEIFTRGRKDAVMKTIDHLEIIGYCGLAVPNSIVRTGGKARHLAVVFPGLRYSTSMPGCYYPALAMLAKGADVLNVDYEYANPGFQELPPREQSRWIAADASAAVQAARAQGKYESITLIGKSLGTIALGQLLAADPPLPDADFIWLTPVLKSPPVHQAMMSRRHHGLIVIGTADTQYDESLLAEAVQSTGGESLVLPGVDHGLEIPGDALGSIQAVETIVRKINDFIG
jgi:hypothetical protein